MSGKTALMLAALLLAAFLTACGDDGLDQKCVDACRKLDACYSDIEAPDLACRYRCTEPDLTLNEELADCIIATRCEDLTELCY